MFKLNWDLYKSYNSDIPLKGLKCYCNHQNISLFSPWYRGNNLLCPDHHMLHEVQGQRKEPFGYLEAASVKTIN